MKRKIFIKILSLVFLIFCLFSSLNIQSSSGVSNNLVINKLGGVFSTIFGQSQTQLKSCGVLLNKDIEVYTIFDDAGNYLFERDEVEVGDSYLSKDFKLYEISHIDQKSKSGIAKFIKFIEKPNVTKSTTPTPINVERRVICMYMTHNDESYVPSDKVDSVYGNGGIKDVALSLKSELEKHLIDVYFDDTLHIPHDTSAYSRSLKTAQKLQNDYSPDAIFDIHRDGASRAYYIANVDGVERCKVRIVVGKANPNKDLNTEFATYLMTVGNEMYPWLFTDIYFARGHYNQALDSKAILFEMGSHLVEKEKAMDSMKELSDVITKTLYNTTVNSNSGSLTINGTENGNNKTVNNILNTKENKKLESYVISIIIVIFATICVYSIIVFFKIYKKSKNKSKK